jgi:hypothetical protein
MRRSVGDAARPDLSQEQVLWHYCSPGLRHDAHVHLPGMPHVLPYLDFHAAARDTHFVGHPHRVIAQHFVATHQNEGWGQAGQVAVKRRGVWMARVCAGEAKIHYTWR